MIGRVHLPLFLLALTIALVIKVAVSEKDEITEKTIEARITYNRPDGVMILDRIKEVELRLRGPRADLQELNPINVEVMAEIGPNQLGTVPVVLQRANVRAPGDVEVVSIQPNTFNVEVEPVREVVLPVRVELIGEPAAGARPGNPTVRPAWAEARGPSSSVNDLTYLTAAVSIERKALSFETTVPIVADDEFVEVQPARAMVLVPMTAPELSQPVGALPRDDGDAAADADAGDDAHPGR